MLMVCVLVGFNVYAVIQIPGTIFDPVKYTGDNENSPTVNVSGSLYNVILFFMES